MGLSREARATRLALGLRHGDGDRRPARLLRLSERWFTGIHRALHLPTDPQPAGAG